MGKKTTTDYFIFGRRRGDIALMVDFTQKRAIVRANTAWIESGVDLETIPVGPHGYAPGMVLMKNGWFKQYFLIERQGWRDQDYFNHAEKLMGQMGIREP